jgi:hypothetical protein
MALAPEAVEVAVRVQEILGSPAAFDNGNVPEPYVRIMKACQNLKYRDMSEGLLLELEAIISVLHEENLPVHAQVFMCKMVDLLRASERTNANLNRNQLDIREQISQIQRTGGRTESSLIE